MKKYYITASLVAITLGVLLFTNSSPKESEKQSDEFSQTYKIASPPIPEGIEFAGELVPLGDMDVKERLDREILVNTFWQSNTMLLIKRSKKYFPIIEPILKSYNIPDDFKYLAVAESGLTQATSPAGAKGFWQFMPATGKSYGLEVNQGIDERLHLKKSTQAACEYLLKAKSATGSWTMAAAGYNRGTSGIVKDAKYQGSKSYYDLYLNSETSRYVMRILALKTILSQPETYGFYISPKDVYTYPETVEIEVDTTISDLSVFAQNMSLKYKDIKLLNPWIKRKTLPNKSRRTYYLEIPK
jgi:hypothetical protein